MKQPNIEQLATEFELSAILGVSGRKIRAAISAGRLEPDFTSGRGRFRLFRTNLERLRSVLQAVEMPHKA